MKKRRGSEVARMDDEIFEGKKKAAIASRGLIAEQTGSDRAGAWHLLPARSLAAGFRQSHC